MTSRGFQALLTRDNQRSCLEACHRHLKPTGLVAIDLFNTRLPSLVVPGGVEETKGEYIGPNGEIIREIGHVDYDLMNQNLVWRVRYECTGRDGSVIVRKQEAALHYFFRFEIEWMLEACGFSIEALYGNFNKSPFTVESPEMIFIARKR